MKNISMALLVSLVVVLVLIYFLQIPFDENFVSGFLNGLLSNLIIFILGVFVIDRILKKIEHEKLIDINKQKSEKTLLTINVFALKILKHLNLHTDGDLDFVINNRALENLLKINREQDWFDILYKQVLSTPNKKDYLKKLETIIKDGATSVNKSLKDAYPHPAPDLALIADEIYILSGNALAMSVMSDFRKKVNKNIDDIDNKMSEETERVIVKVFINHGAKELFSSICDKLLIISNRAHKNRLFVE
jgi:hypothetical protein